MGRVHPRVLTRAPRCTPWLGDAKVHGAILPGFGEILLQTLETSDRGFGHGCNDLMYLKQWKSPPNEKERQEAWSKTKQAWWPGSWSPREAASLTRTMLSGFTSSLFSALPSSWLWIFCTRTVEKTGERGRMQRLPESLTQ